MNHTECPTGATVRVEKQANIHSVIRLLVTDEIVIHDRWAQSNDRRADVDSTRYVRARNCNRIRQRPFAFLLVQGGSRHQNMRRAAEKVIDQLVVMKRNGRRPCHIFVCGGCRKHFVEPQRRQLWRRHFNSKRCGNVRYGLRFRHYARELECGDIAWECLRDAQDFICAEIPEPTHEWGPMLREDLSAHKLRKFLTADKKEFVAIRAAFDMFDTDKSGSIDAREFQSLCFEIGEVLSKRQVANAVHNRSVTFWSYRV